MNPARQALRFSIPGSILLLYFLGLVTAVQVVQGDSRVTARVLGENVAPLVGILASIPIGFLVYQAYYTIYGPLVRVLPLRWNGRLVRADRGSQVLHQLAADDLERLRGLFGVDLEVGRPYKARRTGAFRALRLLELTAEYREQHAETLEAHYRKRWHENWDVLRAVLEISASRSTTQQIKHEYTTLSDLYHALGASRTALSPGLMAATGVTFAHSSAVGGLRTGLALGLCVLITAILWVMLHRARRRTWKSAAASLTYGLQWLFTMHSDLFELPPRRAVIFTAGLVP